MIRTIVQLDERQAEGLRKQAREQGVSVSELVRRCVDLLLSNPSEDEEIRRRAMDAVGYIESGSGDLSTDHDKYLAEAYSR